jgi:FkbM family methyltransferase
MPFVSYAQNFEDVMLKRALASVSQGFFIDVGAGYPEADSVTRGFKDLGWRGINIEPLHDPFQQLIGSRQDDINLQVALGSTPGDQTFYEIVNANGLSTTKPEIAKKHKIEGREVKETTVPRLTLREVCDAYVDGPIHFLKIDVEGSERDVLEGADFSKYRPWIIVLESNHPNSTKENYHLWEELLIQAGYEFAYRDGLNRFYVAAEHANSLSPHFEMPPNYFDFYIRGSELALKQAADVAKQTAEAATLKANEAQTNMSKALPAIAELERLTSENEKIRLQLTTAEAERDSYQRELFATNRHTAWLSFQHQNITQQMKLERHSFIGSTSWRLTAPLRRAMSLIQRFRRG